MDRGTCNDTTNFNYKVTQTHRGQPRPYADSYYEFTIESERPEQEVKRFCTEFLRPCRRDIQKWNEDQKTDAAAYFAGYYTFSKSGENQYRYKVTEPYCD